MRDSHIEINGRTKILKNRDIEIITPTFMPVITFNDKKHPLEYMVRPYLKRTSQCLMISYYYARRMKKKIGMPLFIDSGGFASITKGVKVIEERERTCLKTADGEIIDPADVLELQAEKGNLGATLDFIILPHMDMAEAKERQKLTIKNALYALTTRYAYNMILYASLQCWDEQSARDCARQYRGTGFDGVAIGGLVPRSRDAEYIKRVVLAVREELPDMALHVFGIGRPELLEELWKLGADSADSSSYIRSAVGIEKAVPKYTWDSRVVGEPHAPLVAVLNNLWEIKHQTDNIKHS